MIVLARYEKGALNAGPKAKTDIEKICKKEFDAKIKTFSDYNTDGKIVHTIKKILSKIYPFIVLKRKELAIVQIPYSDFSFTVAKPKTKIALIHDINGLRYDDEKKLKKEIKCLSKYQYIIAHNEAMKEYLISKGIQKDKIYCLNLFDYLCEGEAIKKDKFDKKNIRIGYAGNLSEKKCPFIYQIDKNKINFSFVLYGVGISKDINNKMLYAGSYQPDDLPNNMNVDLGLVWDGNYNESDENKDFKKYTKYNNPHKLSCYLAAGIPVIVWEKAATAEFVKKENIGYTINNIYDINKLDFSDYKEKENNVKKIFKKIRKGYYTKKVIEEVLSNIDK